MNKCVFLDRDGVLNKDRGTYTWEKEDFEIIEGVPEALLQLKQNRWLLIVISNQAGIQKGMYKPDDVLTCHELLQEACEGVIDDIFFSRYHDDYTRSLSRKPESLLFEKAIAKYDIDPNISWMVGDAERDIIPAKKMGLNTALITSNDVETISDIKAKSLLHAITHIVN